MNMALFDTASNWNNAGETTAEAPGSAAEDTARKQEERAIVKLKRFTSRKADEYILCHVLRSVRNGRLHYVATDGKVLVAVSRDTDEQESEQILDCNGGKFPNWRAVIPAEVNNAPGRIARSIDLRHVPKMRKDTKADRHFIEIALPPAAAIPFCAWHLRETAELVTELQQLHGRTSNATLYATLTAEEGKPWEVYHITANAGKWHIDMVCMMQDPKLMERLDSYTAQLSLESNGVLTDRGIRRGVPLRLAYLPVDSPDRPLVEQAKKTPANGIVKMVGEMTLEYDRREKIAECSLVEKGVHGHGVRVPVGAHKDAINDFIRAHEQKILAYAEISKNASIALYDMKETTEGRLAYYKQQEVYDREMEKRLAQLQAAAKTHDWKTKHGKEPRHE